MEIILLTELLTYVNATTEPFPSLDNPPPKGHLHSLDQTLNAVENMI